VSKLFLSNSQVDTFTTCNRKWWLDKREKIRPTYKATALHFGSSIDEAVETILLKPEEDYRAAYLNALANFEVNGKAKTVKDDLLDIKFFASDLDHKLIVDDYLERFNAAVSQLDLEPLDVKDYIEYCKQQRRSKTALTDVEQTIFNTIGILSLEHKGLLIIEKLKEWLDANVARVISVQKKIQISNANGDSFIGYLDFIVELKDGRIVLIDLKTSSNPKLYYPPESASESRQLGIYSQEEGVTDVAYLVADKVIRVREPRVRLSFVEGTITEEHLDDVFEEIEEVTNEIKEKLPYGIAAFEKNLDSCMNFGGCQYRDYCSKGCSKGLEYVK
jgi:CRISPR/Cas system-associated exonuclease Cas4 (RecB family)